MLFLIIIIVAYVVKNRAVCQFEYSCSGCIDNISVMRYIKDSTRIAVNRILKNLLGYHVKMVGRLIENKKVSL